MFKEITKPMRALIIPVRDSRNKGDLAILKSEVDILKKDMNYDDVVVSSLYLEQYRTVEPNLNVQPALIDFWTISPRRYAWVYTLIKLMMPMLWLFQVTLLPIQLLLARYSRPLPYRPELYYLAAHSNTVFLTGGSYLMDVGSKNDIVSWPKLISRFLFLVGFLWQIQCLKWIAGAKVISFPQSLGPFCTGLGRVLVKRIVHATDLFFVREHISIETAKQLKVEQKCVLVHDIAFHLSTSRVALDRAFARPVLGVAPRICPLVDTEKYIKAHAALADWWISEYRGSVLFLPSNELGDGSNSDDAIVVLKIMDNMKQPDKSDYISISKSEIYKSLLGSVDVLVATRMHPTILATPLGTPFIPIYYEHKQEGLAEQLGVDQYLVDIADVSEELLVEKVALIYEQRESVRQQLLEKVSEILLERNEIVEHIRKVIAV